MTKAFYKTIASLLILFSSIAQAQITPANNKISVDVSTYHVQNPAYNYDSSLYVVKPIWTIADKFLGGVFTISKVPFSQI